MQLSRSEKAGLFLSDATGWFGLVFTALGVFFVIVFMPNTDIESVHFATREVWQTTGQVLDTASTKYHENEGRVRAVGYRYSVAGQRLNGRSFSLALRLKPGDSVRVAYVAANPNYSRIEGAAGAPYSLWELLFILVFPTTGLWHMSRRARRVRYLLGIIADGDLAVATCQRLQVIPEKHDEGTHYDAHYTYTVRGREYAYVLRTADPKEFGIRERILFQRTAPAKAVLLVELPSFVRAKFQS